LLALPDIAALIADGEARWKPKQCFWFGPAMR
jgi:hypothetical protein